MAEAMPLFPLREELTLHEGPAAESGAPTWSLQDPVRNSFYRLDWLAFEVITRWHLADHEAIAQAISTETTLTCNPQDIDGVLKFLLENELLQLEPEKGTAWYVERQARRQQGTWRWLLHHYLFFRIPLWRPDHWLARLSPWVAPLFNPTFRWLTAIALGVGLIQVARQWEHFRTMLVDTFSWKGLVGYGIALIFVKLLHELGHAFTAKRYGCRVPTMGVAFLVLWPLAYTDVNDVWKLKHREQRLAVGAAGIVTELTIAAWATLIWALLPDGVLRGMMFMLATTTWVSTLAINASPFLRFDGYFLLADWLDMPNLHARAFALGRWRLREVLFGFGAPPPEYVPTTRRRGLILFAYLTWLYRLVVFLGIAALVYSFVIKALGIFLAIIEIAWFIALPIWRELLVWRTDMARLRHSSRLRSIAWALSALLVLTAFPLRFQIEGHGLLQPAQSYPIVAPAASRILTLPGTSDHSANAGQQLVTLESPDLTIRLLQARQKALFAEWKVAAAGVDVQNIVRLPVFREEQAQALADLEGVQAEISKLAGLAPFTGKLKYLDPDMRPGDWVGQHALLAHLVDNSTWIVDTYFIGEDVGRITVGDRGRFFSETAGAEIMELIVESVDQDASRSLAEPILAVPHGGRLPVREQAGQLVPDQAIYKVRLRVTSPVQESFAGERRGMAVVYGKPESLLGPFIRKLASLLVRESGF
jgi:putative peptide zinc metalloprotease protein